MARCGFCLTNHHQNCVRDTKSKDTTGGKGWVCECKCPPTEIQGRNRVLRLT